MCRQSAESIEHAKETASDTASGRDTIPHSHLNLVCCCCCCGLWLWQVETGTIGFLPNLQLSLHMNVDDLFLVLPSCYNDVRDSTNKFYSNLAS